TAIRYRDLRGLGARPRLGGVRVARPFAVSTVGIDGAVSFRCDAPGPDGLVNSGVGHAPVAGVSAYRDAHLRTSGPFNHLFVISPESAWLPSGTARSYVRPQPHRRTRK